MKFDFEYVLVLTLLFFLFFISLKKKDLAEFIGGNSSLFVIDIQMSGAIKGIACVLILLGHWANMRISPNFSNVSKIVWMFSSNIALTWFMFFSGYGMSLKRITNIQNVWEHSILKIYLPSLLVGLSAFTMYVLLPVTISYEEVKTFHINENLYLLQHFSLSSLYNITESLLLGNGSWYVICIMMFYSLFFCGHWISQKKGVNISIVLGFLFLIYFIFAYLYFGKPQAHYYRYCWTFLFGHAVATRTKQSLCVFIFSLLTIITENWILHVSYILAVVGLCVFSMINGVCEFKGKILSWLGFISYFFYLSHESIGYVCLTYMNINSIIVWILITVTVSSCLYKLWQVMLVRKI